jgi:lipopolysaccharide biosynthesis glycosyltransferase
MKKQKDRNFEVVLACDDRYSDYLNATLASIRSHSADVPISVYTSGGPLLSRIAKKYKCQKHKVTPPKKLQKSLGTTNRLQHAMTRIAKFTSMLNSTYELIMYIDSDIITRDKIENITQELEIENPNQPIVYSLLKRPHLLKLSDISWLYFKNDGQLSKNEKTKLVNKTFSTNYTVEKLFNIDCWNGGVIYGSNQGVHLLANKWQELYLRMLTGSNSQSFIPNDQLCLWLAVDLLKNDLQVRELPLKWNCMPGHAMKDIMNKPNPNLEEIQKALTDIKLLHLAQNKTDVWAQILINDITSE